jgi:hypothetical protein
MAGLVVFSAGNLVNQGRSQIAAKPFPPGMSFELDNLVEVLVAAGKVETTIGAAVGEAPTVFDLGTPFSTCTIEEKGLLKWPAPLPLNGVYWDVFAKKKTAVKGHAGSYLEVKEALHISASCSDVHLTVLVFAQGGKQIGKNIHVCVEPDGTRWKFTRVHHG